MRRFNIRVESGCKRAIGRSIIVAIVVVIIIVAGIGIYAALGVTRSSLSTSSPASTITTTTMPATSSILTSSSGQKSVSGSSSAIVQSSSFFSSSSFSSSSSSSSQIVSATSTSSYSSNTSSSGSVQNPGKIVYETSNLLSSLDPAYYSDSGSQTVQFNVYENLLQYEGNSTKIVYPWLAQNYTVSPDGLTYTFNLRQGIKFQDGTPFNASAVVFSINRAVLTDSSSSTLGLLVGTQAPGIINGSYYYSATYGKGSPNYTQSQVNAYMNSKGVVVGSNPYQVIFHLGYPDASFPYLLPLSVAEIVSPSYVIAHWSTPTNGHGYITGVTAGSQDQFMNNHMSGTGPFQFSSWDQTTGDVVLLRNPNYWGSPLGNGVAKVSEVDINFVQSDSARVLDLKSGTADISDIATSDTFAFINKTAWQTSHQVVPITPGVSVYGPNTELNMYYIAWNYRILNPDGTVSSFQPFRNKNFRLAFADAINASDILYNAANGLGRLANGVIPYGMDGYNASIPLYYNYNLTDSAGNLSLASKALGFSSSNPKTIQIVYAIGDSTGQAVCTELATNINNMGLGIIVQVVPQTENQYVSGIVGGYTPAEAISFNLDYADATDYLASFSSALDIGLYDSYNNSAYLNLVNQQSGETNATLRQHIISEATLLLNQDVAYVFLYYPSVFGETGQMFRSWLSGFVFNAAFPGPYFYQFSKG